MTENKEKWLKEIFLFCTMWMQTEERAVKEKE
jgi:hypothetical protein